VIGSAISITPLSFGLVFFETLSWEAKV